MKKAHCIIALALPFIFGLGWIFGKAALDHFPPILMAALRFGTAGLIMLPFVEWPKIKLHHLILLSALAIGIPYSLSNYGLSKLDVSTTVLLVQLEAPFLIMMSLLFLRERPSGILIIGVTISFFGVILVCLLYTSPSPRD